MLVSDAIISGLTDPGAFHFRSLGAVIPKGKSELSEIFEDRCAEHFDRGVAHFRAGNFSGALEIFEALALDAPGDGAIAHFQRRCAELKTREGDKPWDGVERFELA